MIMISRSFSLLFSESENIRPDFFIFLFMNETSQQALSEKLTSTAKAPRFRGAIFQIEADEKGLALIDCKESSLKVYIMVDPENDQILETRFFTYGGPIFTALADTFCKAIQDKKIEDLSDIRVSDLETELRDTPSVPSMPLDSLELKSMELLIEKILETYPEKKVTALLIRENMEKIKYKTQSKEGRAEADAEWNQLTDTEKKERIEKCLQDYVRKILHSDGGDLEVLEINGNRVKIRFQGACAGCSAASGSTLFYIEDQLRNNVYYNLVVEPEDVFPNRGTDNEP